jgi:hypothetical protein
MWTIVNTSCQKIENVSSQVERLSLCMPIPIGQNDRLIDASGSYCLFEDLVGSVTISSSDVILDLNGYAISDGLNGVLVNAGTENVAIFNGFIENSLQEGILVQQGCSRISLQDLTLNACGQSQSVFSIDFLGDIANRVKSNRISNVAVSNGSSGIRIFNGDSNLLERITIDNINNDNEAYGILITGDVGSPAIDNVVDECFITTVSSFSSFARGIALVTTQNTMLQGVNIDKVIANGNGAGIYMNNGNDNYLSNGHIQAVESYFAGIGLDRAALGVFVLEEDNYTIDECFVENIYSSVSEASGFGFVGTQNGTVFNCHVKNVLAGLAGNTSTGFSIATFSQRSQNILFDTISASGISALNGGVRGLGIFDDAQAITVRNAFVQGLSGVDRSSGFYVSFATDVSLEDCICADVLNDGDTAGFVIEDAAFCAINRCCSSGVHSLSDVGAGYHILRSSCSSIHSSKSQNVTSVNGLAGGYVVQNSSAVVINDCESACNYAQDSAVGAAGFMGNDSTDVIYDFCLSQSVSVDLSSTGLANGFYMVRGSNIQILNSTSAMNDDAAFHLDVDSNSCLVNSCLASYSNQGFVDLAMTSTFINNNSLFNSALAANYIGVPLVGMLGDPTTLGLNLSA